MKPVNLGAMPTPALTYYALQQRRGSMMITGSHIPFDRNGYKANSAKGELLKKDEAPINARVEQVRQRLFAQPYELSLFNQLGFFKAGHQELPAVSDAARQAYLRRYTDFFAGQTLCQHRLLVYQHSAVGRDLLAELLQQLGAEVIATGRSETFVPIDTENIDQERLAAIQTLAEEAWSKHGPLTAVVSTDGDSDRPLLLAVNPSVGRSVPLSRAQPSGGEPPCQVQFFGGDLVGMLVAEYLGADAVVVPISSNDALDRGPLKNLVEPKTRIGSPHVIAGMDKARQKGRQAVCGWEANGGFLTGSDIQRAGKELKALPTRDAILPLLGVLFSTSQHGCTVSELFGRLPKRFSRAALLKNFPRPVSQRIIARFSPSDARIKEVSFGQQVTLTDENGQPLAVPEAQRDALLKIRLDLKTFFSDSAQFSAIARLNYIDGVRIYFENGDVAHVRPSGNADELRIYAVADTQARADAIANLGVCEPDGILRQLERAVV